MLITFGHGTASAGRITGLLHGAGIGALVDVRIAPGSRRSPHVARAELERWLPAAGVAYRWEKPLGGRRPVPPDSPDTAWREPAFRGYAAWMRQATFAAAVDGLLSQVDEQVAAAPDAPHVAVMCSESSWRNCHRRLVADFVTVARQREVCHLGHDGTLSGHEPSPGLRHTEAGLLVYDGGQDRLL